MATFGPASDLASIPNIDLPNHMNRIDVAVMTTMIIKALMTPPTSMHRRPRRYCLCSRSRWSLFGLRRKKIRSPDKELG